MTAPARMLCVLDAYLALDWSLHGLRTHTFDTVGSASEVAPGCQDMC